MSCIYRLQNIIDLIYKRHDIPHTWSTCVPGSECCFEELIYLVTDYSSTVAASCQSANLKDVVFCQVTDRICLVCMEDE